MKFLEEKIGSNFSDTGFRNIFLDMSPLAKDMNAKLNYWDYTKIKSFFTVKEIINKAKRQTSEWEKIFANDMSDKMLISKLCKELIQLDNKKSKQFSQRTGRKTE